MFLEFGSRLPIISSTEAPCQGFCFLTVSDNRWSFHIVAVAHPDLARYARIIDRTPIFCMSHTARPMHPPDPGIPRTYDPRCLVLHVRGHIDRTREQDACNQGSYQK